MTNIKVSWKDYYKPTPTMVRKIADALAGAAVFAGSISQLNGCPKLATGIFIAGFATKFLSNFLSARPADDDSTGDQH